ncbi:MAG: FCD domain-containing protein [Acidimicrobiales bacterium]
MARPQSQRRSPRLAEDVANQLRGRILAGEFAETESLPTQDRLVEEYRVSLPSVREALRILETEGLLTVLRGKVGGSVVHVPQTKKVGYMLGLVLESRGVEVDEVLSAIAQVEPLCAAACARREDRLTTVVPELEEIQAASTVAIDDPAAFARAARRFHEVLVEGCGNQPLVVIVGALEALWSGQVETAGDKIDFGAFPEVTTREASLEEHRQMIDHIAAGDPEKAAAAAQAHNHDPGRHQLSGQSVLVSAEPLRES